MNPSEKFPRCAKSLCAFLHKLMIASCQTVDSFDSITAATHTHPVKIHAAVEFDCLLCSANQAGASRVFTKIYNSNQKSRFIGEKVKKNKEINSDDGCRSEKKINKHDIMIIK